MDGREDGFGRKVMKGGEDLEGMKEEGGEDVEEVVEGGYVLHGWREVEQ